MTCTEYERTCELLASADAGSRLPEVVREHGARCEACQEAMRVFEVLERGRGAFAVPDPGSGYWTRFREGLDARLDSEREVRSGVVFGPSPWARIALGIATACLLVVSVLAIRRTGAPERASEAGADSAVLSPSPAPPAGWEGGHEEELVMRLGRTPADRVQEALEELGPMDASAGLEDLAELERWLTPGVGSPTGTDSPYDLFFDLGEQERIHLLKEIRGEIG